MKLFLLMLPLLVSNVYCQDDTKGILTDKKKAVTFLSRHKRGLSEECSDNEGGCSWEEVAEVHGSGGVRNYMIRNRCSRLSCPQSTYCTHLSGGFGHLYDVRVHCKDLCGGKKAEDGACRVPYTYDRIIYRGGSSRNSGEGTCTAPATCTGCKSGFYPQNGGTDGYCRICPYIANCYHRQCTNTADNYCEYCHNEVKDKLYWRGYTRHYDGQMKQCRKACSWRSDSNRCYPGICTDETVESCVCTGGFGGHHCATIMEYTSILYAETKLHNPSNETVTTPLDPNEPGHEPTRFTNKDNLNEAEIEFHGKFVASGTPPDLTNKLYEDHYVTEFKYGIVYGQMTTNFIRSSGFYTQRYSCPGNENSPINLNYICSRTRSNASGITLPSFDHADRLIYTIEVRNGGYLKYVDRENHNNILRASLQGKTKTISFTVQWDYSQPYYSCFKLHRTNCTVSPIELQDVTDNKEISISWREWTDDLAGVESYEYEVFYLQFNGRSLTERNRVTLMNKTLTPISESNFNVTIPGMYSIIFTAFDKAGNYKSTRSVFLFDDQSIVQTTSGTRMIVTESTSETNYTWVVTDTSQLHVKWPGRFMNERHHVKHWLDEVGNHTDIDSTYDDSFGKRTVEEVTNVKGVVKFDINYTVSGPDITLSQSFVNVDDIKKESKLIDVTWEDGQKLDIYVMATDLIGEYTIDTIVLYKDTTEPEIENLWLSHGGKTTLSIHRLEDFSEMTLEWDTFDYHSGIESVHWRLYDNFTGSDVLHGHSYTTAQGNVDNMTACEEEYLDSPRGHDCYCTLYHGCFHRHFYIQPKIANDSGLIPGKDKGMHDYDYFIEITVVNKAMLTTTITKKITIDITAPEVGFVHDGLYGTPEVDYQQDFHLNVHWSGFFDAESGVDYYKYIFSDHCWNRDDLAETTKGDETYKTFATYEAEDEGTYYVSVIAMNSANDASQAVCSDGVTVVKTKPSVKNVILKGAKTAPRLVADANNTLWIISNDLMRTVINETDVCKQVMDVTIVDDIRLFPETNITENNCRDIYPVPTMFLSVIPRSSQLTMTWEPDVENKLIYDYEIGLSSTKDSLAPDLVPYRSTKHHQHFRLNYPDLTEGTLFYVVIKTTSKANVEGIQMFGPIIVDVTAPKFTGSHIDVELKDKTIVANWSKESFTDEEDPYHLAYEFALGHVAGGTDIAGFQPLTYNKHCVRTIPPECTAIGLSSLEWTLHGNHDYYVTIKVTNLAGLTTTHTSVVYTHDVQPPSPGVVLDINPTNIGNRRLQDIVDVDFSIVSDKLSVEWNNFYHPHLDLYFNICVGTTIGGCDVITEERIDGLISKHTFNNLALTVLQTYYITVEAIAKTGSVKVTSDGVTIIDNKTELTGLVINDGPICSDQLVLNGSHHDWDVIPICGSDIDYQTLTINLGAKWEIPSYIKPIIRSAFCSIDRKFSIGDVWSQYREFTYTGSDTSCMTGELDLQPGLTYRSTIKLCADDICFPVSHSDGVTIVPNKPVTGSLEVQFDGSRMTVIFNTMYDPDIEDMSEAMDVVTLYEWTIIDGSYGEGMYENWRIVNNLQKINNTHSKFEVLLTGDIDFAKCKHMNVKGYNKAGVWSGISTEIKQCHVEDGHSHIIPRIIIDAIGKPDGEKENGIGKDVYLEENTAWTLPDIDYTPYQNILSAVWPSLRHKSYNWGVLKVEVNNADTFYKDFTEVLITDPCSHPETIKCGNTTNNYINVRFNESDYLVHGKRYAICVHAPKTEIEYEKWTEVLDEVKTCSDGVTVDLTPPGPGNVWVGHDRDQSYQISSSDIVITWDSFVDVEEQGRSMHSTGITKYLVSVGSTDGGVDIVDKENVGVTNRVSFHGLKLQNGHKYYVTVMGYDHINRSAEIHSNPVTIDVTPPEITEESILVNGRHLRNISEIEACWTDVFMDIESGIDYFLWGVGSQAGQDDVIPFSSTSQQCDVSFENNSWDLKEGHPYFITVKAFNRAGLSATKSSWAYTHDISPPSNGHVYDVKLDTVSTHSKDIDYQTEMTQLSVSWEGFHDPHSAIKYYNVHIGKCPGCSDVIVQQYVGIHTEFTLFNINLEVGIRYYSTVTACNTANLCTSVMSDGVVIDNSPPVPGIVQDGVDELDAEYQSTRNYIATKWYGFTDSQSGIDFFVIRVGTARGSGDVISPTRLTETDQMFITDLPSLLPLNHRIFTTIRAYNKAAQYQPWRLPAGGLQPFSLRQDVYCISIWSVGHKLVSCINSDYITIRTHISMSFICTSKTGLFSESTSNGFLIDISTPYIITKPSMSHHLGSVIEGTSILRSAIRFTWEVEDRQSFIQRQYMSITSHVGGDFNASSIQVNGIVREYTLANLNLHDGGIYFLKLIVCNGAQMCTETQSDGVLVDNSPPTSGMFAISTYHAAELQRHTPEWMNWSDYRLNISWLGFTDLHCTVDKYFVSVGSQYMSNDLNKVPGQPMEFTHNDSGITYKDEGPIQYVTVSTQKLTSYEHVYISVWAVNQVGLQSSMVMYQFQLIPGGFFDLIRRCTANTCLGNCVCSSRNKRCILNGDSCREVTLDNSNTLISVKDVIDLSGSENGDVDFIPSNSVLLAKWKIDKQQGLPPLWYEWSVGLTSQDHPEGVIDTMVDSLWHHAGKGTEAVYCLKQGQKLTELLTYSVFVRVWYSQSVYAVFKSSGVTVHSKATPVNVHRGAAVVEKIPSFWKSDVDFIKPGALFTISWKNVFIARPGTIKDFNVYMSSFPEGADLHKVDLDIASSVSVVNISRLSMSPGVRYYSNVVANTLSGLQTTVSSDGIMIDSTSPVSGTVYDGLGIYDLQYQNKSDIAAATWHGFTDIESGIVQYLWCVGTDNTNQNCDILPWTHVGMHTSVSAKVQHRANGDTVYSRIKAVDGVGHSSDIKSTNGVTIDTTPPVPISYRHNDNNLVTNPSFEETKGCLLDISNISTYNLCTNDDCYQPIKWSKDGCITTISSDVDTAYHGRSFIFLSGSVRQSIQDLTPGDLYRVSFVTSHPPISTAVISNLEGSVKFDNKEHLFHFYTKDKPNEIVWHLHTFYFRPTSYNCNITIGNLNRNNGFLLDDIKVQVIETSPENEGGLAVHVNTVILHQWSSVHASWNFADAESPITEYLWAIGSTNGNAEIQNFESVGLNNFGYNYNVTLAHSAQVYITVVAINNAGLHTKAYSTGIYIDRTPPVIQYVNDGTGVDVDGQTSNVISSNWEVTDPESNVDFCEWSIGIQPYGNELQAFTKTVNLKSASTVFDENIIAMTTIYTTVRCHNKAGSYITVTSDGLTISEVPPSSDNAVITILPISKTEYGTSDYHQRDPTTIRMKWSGFTDRFDIMSFVVQFDGDSLHLKNSILDINKAVSYMVMTRLDLSDEAYTASVTAINAMYVRSNKTCTNITTQSTSPTIVDGSKIETTKNGDVITVSWNNVFTYLGRLTYEVSVGTTQGGADVIQWQETLNDYLEVSIPEKFKEQSSLNLFFFIRAIGDNGEHTDISNDITV